ncbi:MAG TPA: chemotaxis protein CheW [Gemmatimonadales bacterium]|nr:chemotaxis protein CheW [Gemmatimonadales bacterium]
MTAPARADLARAGALAFADALAAQAQAEPAAAAPDPQLHLIAFRLDREEYGVPVATVREVSRVGDITRVPQAPAHIRGVTNLRGRILPVYEIRTRLGLEPLAPGPKARVVVAEVHGRVLGLLVDAVAQVLKVPADCVVAPPEETRSAQADYVTGVAQLDGRLIILLDLERMLQPGSVPQP